jgi:hypothetical protein
MKVRAQIDALFERMQTPEARRATERFFELTSEELGRAAVEFARRPRGDVQPP